MYMYNSPMLLATMKGIAKDNNSLRSYVATHIASYVYYI